MPEVDRAYLSEDPIHYPVGQRMVPVSKQVLFINQEVVIAVQLPEFTVDDVEVLVREVSAGARQPDRKEHLGTCCTLEEGATRKEAASGRV